MPPISLEPVVVQLFSSALEAIPTRRITRGRLKLLEVLYAGLQYIAKGRKEIMIIPMANKPTARTAIPVHLGLVIKAKELSNIDVQLSKLVKSTG